MENFSILKVRTLDIKDAEQYINDYFICLIDGNHAFKFDDEWTVITEDVLKRVFFNKLSSELNLYYFHTNPRFLAPVKDKTKPQFYDNKINFDYNKNTLPIHYKFLVDEFIYKKVNINHKPNDLFKLYQEFGGLLKKTEFIKCLSDAEIHATKISTNLYKLSHELLYEIAIKNEWIHKSKYEVEIDNLKNKLVQKDEEIDNLVNKLVNKEEYAQQIEREIMCMKSTENIKNKLVCGSCKNVLIDNHETVNIPFKNEADNEDCIKIIKSSKQNEENEEDEEKEKDDEDVKKDEEEDDKEEEINDLDNDSVSVEHGGKVVY